MAAVAREEAAQVAAARAAAARAAAAPGAVRVVGKVEVAKAGLEGCTEV